MTQSAQLLVDFRPGAERVSRLDMGIDLGSVRLDIYRDPLAIEQTWREFEQRADCTVFQTFDWLATWQRHIGVRNGVKPAIVVGTDAGGRTLFLLPLAIEPIGSVRKLTWLGSELCDYNAPLVAADFALGLDPASFVRLWHRIERCLRSDPDLQYDLVHLSKMPDLVRVLPNPMLHLKVTRNSSGAHLTRLGSDWNAFYAEKRPPATRKRDRNQRKRLSQFGEIRLVNPDTAAEISNTLDTFMDQKAHSFANLGIPDIFGRPGYREFFHALALDKSASHLVHVSRLDVGSRTAAANLGLTFRGCYYHLLTSHDCGELSQHSPGRAHLHDLLRLAIERGFKTFDFTIGDEPYKRDWCNVRLELYDYVSAVTIRGALVAVPLRATSRLKRWIKQTPALWRTFTRWRTLLGWLASRPGSRADRTSKRPVK